MYQSGAALIDSLPRLLRALHKAVALPTELLFVQKSAARRNYAVLVMCAPGGRVNARQGLDPPHRL